MKQLEIFYYRYENFLLYNRTITDIEKGVFYYEIINREKDSNNEFIVYKTPIEIEDISENSNWEEELLKEKNLGQLTQLRKKIRDDEIQRDRIGNLNHTASIVWNEDINDYKNIEQLIVRWFKDHKFEFPIFIPELDKEIDYGIPEDEYWALSKIDKVRILVDKARDDTHRDPNFWKTVFDNSIGKNGFYTELGRVRGELTAKGIKRPFSTNGMRWYTAGR